MGTSALLRLLVAAPALLPVGRRLLAKEGCASAEHEVNPIYIIIVVFLVLSSGF